MANYFKIELAGQQPPCDAAGPVAEPVAEPVDEPVAEPVAAFGTGWHNKARGKVPESLRSKPTRISPRWCWCCIIESRINETPDTMRTTHPLKSASGILKVNLVGLGKSCRFGRGYDWMFGGKTIPTALEIG